MENEVFNIFSFNNFFKKSNIFGENEGKKMLWGYGRFLGEGISRKLKMNTSFFIEN